MLLNIYRCIDRSQLQFDFVIYTDKKQDYEDEVLRMGGRIFRVTLPSVGTALRTVRDIRNILLQQGPYIAIHAHTLHSSVYPMLASMGYKDIVRVAHSHNTKMSGGSRLVKRIYAYAAAKTLRILSDVWLACGHDAGMYLFGKAFRLKGKVLPNGICIREFKKDYTAEIGLLKEQLGIVRELIIGSVARLEPVKNHTFMLKIAKRMKEQGMAFKMLFAGRGSSEECLREEVKQYQLEDNVVFLGIRQDIPELLHLFDVFLMPSHFEGAPVSLVEAQACKLPCLVSTSVPDDADLSLGLIRKCDLSANIDSWVDMLRCHNRKFVTCTSLEIESAFVKSGYNVEASAQELQQIYFRKIEPKQR